MRRLASGARGGGEAENMANVFEEDAHMGHDIALHQRFVHITFPSEALHIAITTNLHKGLAQTIAAISEGLHDPQHQEDATMIFHETLASGCQGFGIGGAQSFMTSISCKTAGEHRIINALA